MKICYLDCLEYFTASTVDVSMYINLAVKKVFRELPIEEIYGQRSKLDAEYQEGLELLTMR